MSCYAFADLMDFCVWINPPQSRHLEGSSSHRRAHGSSARARCARSQPGIWARTGATAASRSPLCCREEPVPPAVRGITGEHAVIFVV